MKFNQINKKQKELNNDFFLNVRVVDRWIKIIKNIDDDKLKTILLNLSEDEIDKLDDILFSTIIKNNKK